MPNTPSLVREGASGFCCDTQVDATTRDWIQSVLSCVGLAVEVAETQMDAVTGLSGSGPAYVCLIIEAALLMEVFKGIAPDSGDETGYANCAWDRKDD